MFVKDYKNIPNQKEREFVENKIKEVLKGMVVISMEERPVQRCPEIKLFKVTFKSGLLLFTLDVGVSIMIKTEKAQGYSTLDIFDEYMGSSKKDLHYFTELNWFDYYIQSSSDDISNSYDEIESVLQKNIKKKKNMFFVFNKDNVLHIGRAFFFTTDNILVNTNKTDDLDWSLYFDGLISEEVPVLLQKVYNFYYNNLLIDNINKEFVEKHYISSKEVSPLYQLVSGSNKNTIEEFKPLFKKVKEMETIEKQSLFISQFYTKKEKDGTEKTFFKNFFVTLKKIIF